MAQNVQGQSSAGNVGLRRSRQRADDGRRAEPALAHVDDVAAASLDWGSTTPLAIAMV
jgi:hypothetical protein